MADTYQAVVIAVGPHSEAVGAAVGGRIERAGQTVTDRHNTSASDAVRHVSALAGVSDTDLICVVADDRDVLAQVGGLVEAPLPVLSSVYGVRRFHAAGGNALGETFIAARLQSAVVLVVPPIEPAADLAMDLVLPALPSLCGGAVVSFDDSAEDIEELVAEPVEDEEESVPQADHTTSLGSMSLGSSEMGGGHIDEAVPGDFVPAGWKKWLKEHDATILTDRREDLPNAIDELAPVVQVLHTAGQQAVLKVGRNKMSLWGWPDLERPNSKVIAVGWGLPFVEVVALHRHPTPSGLAIEEDRALVLQRDTDLATLSKELTGRALKNTDGKLFAAEKGRIWVERDDEVIYEWDGKKERNIGTRNQALATLLLHWSQK